MNQFKMVTMHIEIKSLFSLLMFLVPALELISDDAEKSSC